MVEKGLKKVKEQQYFWIPVDEILGPGKELLVSNDILDSYVSIDFNKGNLRLQAKGMVGVFPLTSNLSVQVRPRFPIANLERMIDVAGDDPTVLALLRNYDLSTSFESWMWHAFSNALLLLVDKIRDCGLILSYRRKVADSTHPNGRIMIAETISKYAARGVGYKVATSGFERSADNQLNRLLYAAILATHRYYDSLEAVDFQERVKLEKEKRSILPKIAGAIHFMNRAGVSVELDSSSLERLLVDASDADRLIPESRGYYRHALDVSRVLLGGRGVDILSGGDASSDVAAQASVEIPSITVDMQTMFEKFVRTSLAARMGNSNASDVSDRNPELLIIDGNKYSTRLYEGPPDWFSSGVIHYPIEGGNPKMTPDIVIERSDGHCLLVAEVKYSPTSGHAKRHEVEQSYLYGARYNTPVAMTVHPCSGNERAGLYSSGSIGNIMVVHYKINLAAEDLDSEMDDFADTVRNIAILIDGL